MRDGRPFWPDGLVILPTLRVCMQCGATWEANSTPFGGTIKHKGPHDPNLREYRRSSLWSAREPTA